MIDSFADVVCLLAGYLLATFGAGWVVGRLVPPPPKQPPPLPLAAGLSVPVLIGWSERFLIVTFVLVGDTGAIGFIVVAKTTLRFGQSREDPAFAEYVLCGTLVSFSIALAIGLFIQQLLAWC